MCGTCWIVRVELERKALHAPLAKFLDPVLKGYGQLLRHHAMALPRTANVLFSGAEGTELLWERRCRAAPVDELGGDQESIDACVAGDVPWIGPSVFEAVMRVRLSPATSAAMVDVVAVHQFEAAIQNWSLAEEAWILPVRVIIQDLADLHRVDQVAGKLILGLCTRADDPIANGRTSTDLWLAGRECAVPMEGVGCEPVVARDDVRKQFHQQL